MSSHSQKAVGTNGKVRRFERSEIILHWANAVPFVILFITGALNVLSHFLAFSPQVLSIIRLIHKTVGPLWLLCIGVSFFFIGRKLNISNTRDQMGLGLSDIGWMITAFRSAYNPHVDTPPAGKFNTGQKLNADLVILFVIGFSVSGFLMWAFNSMLLPWFVHISLFSMAVASLGGHLYLSFLHPSTRPGLIGIFTGRVPKSYIEHHHSLTLRHAAHDAHEEQDTMQQRDRRSHPRPGYRVFMTAEIIIVVLVLLGGAFGVKTLGLLHKLSRLERGFHAVVNPGDLSKAHTIKEIDNCKKCHEYSGELPNANCLSCHKIIQARSEAGLGYHGKNNDKKCIICHKEHPYDRGNSTGSIIIFDKEKFDHDVAAFKREGKHKDVKCEKCHIRKISTDGNNPVGYYVGLRFDTCLDCHKDFHKGSLGEKCDTCHVVAGWQGKNLKFDHNNAKFHLEGKHANVQCEKCHKPQTPGAALGTAVFRGLKFDRCDDCHKDPHRGELRAGCATCHSSQGWRGNDLKFDHNTAKFHLEGKHGAVKCNKCHRSNMKNGSLELDVKSFKVKHEICSDCHKDPHQKKLDAKCTVCHVTQGWQGKNLKFNHVKAKFRLEGKHAGVQCVKCHKPQTPGAALGTAVFRGLKHSRCDDCHKDPHSGELRAGCATCHSSLGWRGIYLKFDHARVAKFSLVGKHKAVKCVKCHRSNPENGLLDVTSFRMKNDFCSNCHKDPHRGELGTDCAKCHSSLGWRGKDLKFDHNRDSQYPLQGKHKELPCTKCHKTQPEGAHLATTWFKIKHDVCTRCHKKYPHKGVFIRSVICEDCHDYSSWKKKKKR